MVLGLTELLLALLAPRTVPVFRQILKLRPGGDAVVGVANCWVVHIAADRTDILAGAPVVVEIILIRQDGLCQMVKMP